MNKSLRVGGGRILALDSAKGILIILLVFHHVIERCVNLEISNRVVEFASYIQRPLCLCYFMPTFFIISGMCTNFECTFRTYLLKQFRSLFLPAYLFMIFCSIPNINLLNSSFEFLRTGGPYWFLTAMFFCKIIYYYLRRMGRLPCLVCSTMFSLAGTVLYEINFLNDFYWHWQVSGLVLFLAIGENCKSVLSRKAIFPLSAIGYLCVMMIGMHICGGPTRLPYITACFSVKPAMWLLHLALAVFGSCAVISFCNCLPCVDFLMYLGRNSIVVYMTQWNIICLYCSAFGSRLGLNATVGYSCAALFVMGVGVLGFGALVASICNNSALGSMILGRGKKCALIHQGEGVKK